MQEIISLFTEKYGLTTSEVMTETEKVLSAILSQWYRFEVMVDRVSKNLVEALLREQLVYCREDHNSLHQTICGTEQFCPYIQETAKICNYCWNIRTW